jgi:IS30 family transposase
MGERLAFTLVTNCQVYFCHPRGPWQRGTNENANELLWQDLQRALQFFAFPERDLDGIAAELNAQPMRQVTVGVLPR